MRQRRRPTARILLPALALGAAGCWPGAPPAPVPGAPPADALAHQEPVPNPAVHLFADSTRYEVQAGAMGLLEVRIGQAGTAELSYHQEPDGLAVTLRVPVYDAHFESPATGGSRATEAGIGGAFGLRLDHRGLVEITSWPALSPAVLDVTGPEQLVRMFFAPLPGVVVEPGSSWVDTLEVRDTADRLETRSVTITTSVAKGDTLWGDSPALLITTESTVESVTTGQSGGVEIRQRVTGALSGHVLWDTDRHVMLERREAGTMSGTLEMPALGATALPVTGRRVRVIRLLEVPD